MSIEEVGLLLSASALVAGAAPLYFVVRNRREAVRERAKRAEFQVTLRTIDADENGIR